MAKKQLNDIKNENVETGEQSSHREKENFASEKSKIKTFFSKNGKKIASYALCFLLGAGVFLSGWAIGHYSQSESARSLNFLLKIYDKYYLETRDEKAGSDVAKVLADALLDRYSEYYTAEEYEAETKASYGERKGIGITFYNDFSIYSVSGNSPAERAGIEAGGKIKAYKTSSDEDFVLIEENNASEELSSFIEKLSSEEGEISLKIEYPASADSPSETITHTLKRSEYTETYVYYADDSGYYGFSGDEKLALTELNRRENISISGQNAAYIKLTQFNGLSTGLAGGAGQFAAALDKFKEKNKSELILDLRSNGGGFMSILCEIASYLCDYSDTSALCQLAVDKNGKEQRFNMPTSKYKNYGFKNIVILADANSASASEALIGAVLDYDKQSGNNAVTVILSPSTNKDNEIEYKTYGKGIMQSTYIDPFSQEAVKLTTAKIYWPISHVCIHDVGVTDALCEKGYNVISGTTGDVSAAINYLNGAPN